MPSLLSPPASRTRRSLAERLPHRQVRMMDRRNRMSRDGSDCDRKIFLKIVSATYFLDELSSAGSLSGWRHDESRDCQIIGRWDFCGVGDRPGGEAAQYRGDSHR